MTGWRAWPPCRWLRRVKRRITGRDRLEESEARLAEATEERLERVRVLEETAKATAASYRAGSMYEAASLEAEKAAALRERRVRLEQSRTEAPRMRADALGTGYGLNGDRGALSGEMVAALLWLGLNVAGLVLSARAVARGAGAYSSASPPGGGPSTSRRSRSARPGASALCFRCRATAGRTRRCFPA